MKNNKVSRLAHVMDIFGVKGKDLAQYLHVDNSLVSKWKSNKRKLFPRSTILNKMTEFFMALDSSTGNQAIKSILKGAYPEADLNSHTVKMLLGKWLSEYPDGNQLQPSIPTFNKNKYTSQFTAYKDVSGRMQAEFMIMDLILSTPGKHELLILDYGDISWQNKNDSTFQLWKNNYKEILAREHKVIFVNFIDREIHSLIDVLIKIMPMALTGNVLNYYPSVFATSLFKPNLVILKNKAALVGMAAEGFTSRPFVHLYTDLPTIQHCQNLFEAALSSCRLLYEKCDFSERHKFSEVLIDMESYSGDTYISSGMPFFNTLPEELLTKILIENNFAPDDIEECLFFYRKYNKEFYKNLEKYTYRYFYNLDSLKNALASNEVVYNEFRMITGNLVRVSKGYFREHFEKIIQLSEKYPNFQVGLYSRNTENKLEGINIWTKENIITVANKLAIEGEDKPLSIYTRETTVNHAYFRYFSDLWHSIPRADRDRDYVKNKLRQFLSSF